MALMQRLLNWLGIRWQFTVVVVSAFVAFVGSTMYCHVFASRQLEEGKTSFVLARAIGRVERVSGEARLLKQNPDATARARLEQAFHELGTELMIPEEAGENRTQELWGAFTRNVRAVLEKSGSPAELDALLPDLFAEADRLMRELDALFGQVAKQTASRASVHSMVLLGLFIASAPIFAEMLVVTFLADMSPARLRGVRPSPTATSLRF